MSASRFLSRLDYFLRTITLGTDVCFPKVIPDDSQLPACIFRRDLSHLARRERTRRHSHQNGPSRGRRAPVDDDLYELLAVDDEERLLPILSPLHAQTRVKPVRF